MPYKPFHPDIIEWKAFHPQTGRCYSPHIFPIHSPCIQAKHLTEHIQIMIIKKLLVVVMYAQRPSVALACYVRMRADGALHNESDLITH